ncbi:MAG: hypothetical protein PHE12_04600 [Clostridia bacterium]|nr:hypothetical protein [Clostridia bacterium]
MKESKTEKTVIAEKSNFVLNFLLVVYALALMLIILTGLDFDTFWNVVKIIIFFLLLLLLIYFRFLLPNILIECDDKGIYINKSFKRTVYITRENIYNAEHKVYFIKYGKGFLYNHLNEVGTIKIYVKQDNGFIFYTVVNVMHVPATAAAINALVIDKK